MFFSRISIENQRMIRADILVSEGLEKGFYDKRTRSRKFDVGDKVQILLPTESDKLLLQWQGPY